MKRFTVVLLALGMLLSGYGFAHAFGSYLTDFNTQYPNAGAISTCGVCHVNAQNPGARNPYGAAFGSNGNSFTAIANMDSDGDGFTNVAEITNVPPTFPGDPASFPAPAPVTCTSFTYSEFGACQSNNTQTRTVISSSPAGCTGGNPILSQSCTFVPPVNECTSFTYSEFGACQSNNTQTRTVISSLPAGCTGGNPVLSQSCTFVPPVNECTSFTYSEFGACQSNNTQTRTVISSSPAGCTGGNPVLSQSCTFVPPVGSTSVTVNAAEGSGQVTVETMTGGTNLTDVAAISSSDASINQTGKPSGFTFNNGLVSFKLNAVAAGGTAQVKITMPADIPSGSKIYKIRADGFHEFTNAVIAGNTVTLTLVDGGDGDSDGAANGTITDPVGVASPASVPDEDDDGGGCSIGRRSNTQTAFADAAIILMPLIVMGVLRTIRRRKK